MTDPELAQEGNQKEIRGLQFSGRAGRSPVRESIGLLGPYFRKFPFAEAVYACLAARTGPVSLVVYRVATERVWYIDNALGFGSKFTARIESGARVGEFESIASGG